MHANCLCAHITYTHGSRFYRHFCITVLFIFQTDMSPKWFWIIKWVLERRKAATLDKYTAKRPDKIKTRHVKIMRYLQSLNCCHVHWFWTANNTQCLPFACCMPASQNHIHMYTHTCNKGDWLLPKDWNGLEMIENDWNWLNTGRRSK